MRARARCWGWAFLSQLVVAGCAAPAGSPRGEPAIEAIAAELDALSRGGTDGHRATFRAILEDTIAKDRYLCRPSPREVFFGDAPEGTRTISGEMPHYGFFFGPMRYTVRRLGATRGASARPQAPEATWEVRVRIGVDPPKAAELELPDCDLVRSLGVGSCSGVPYSSDPGTNACPGSGKFSTPATPAAIRALLARWSTEAERYYNRDAAYFGIPVVYDFEFTIATEGAISPDGSGDPLFDLVVPLAPTCGRTPYFSAFRSGWSLPIVAHEVGHVLGLLDEYETFSGLASFYPKTPFPGAERSRMGLSMREDTRVLPLHHYLILRRYFCDEPRGQPFVAAPM